MLAIYAKEKPLSVSFKWKFWLNEIKKKKSHAEIAKMFNKNRSSICEIVMKEKEIQAPQTAK